MICRVPQASLHIVDVSLFETCSTVNFRYNPNMLPGVALSLVVLPAELSRLRSCRSVYFCGSVASVGNLRLCVAFCVCGCVWCVCACL